MPQQRKHYVLRKQEISNNITKIHFSNPAKLSGSGGIFAGARFLPDMEKVPDSSQSRNPVQLFCATI